MLIDITWPTLSLSAYGGTRTTTAINSRTLQALPVNSRVLSAMDNEMIVYSYATAECYS